MAPSKMYDNSKTCLSINVCREKGLLLSLVCKYLVGWHAGAVNIPPKTSFWPS